MCFRTVSFTRGSRVFLEKNEKSFKRIERILGGDNKIENSKISEKVAVSVDGDKTLLIRKYKVPDQDQRLRSNRSWVKTVSGICKDITDLDIVVDMKDALALYLETRDVLNFVDWPENIVVNPFNMFVALNFNAFEDSINWEGEMQKLKEKMDQQSEKKMNQQSDTPAVVEKVREFAEKFESPEDNSLLARLREYNSGDDLDELLSTLVSQIIVSHLLEAPDLILKYTRHWAQTFDEKKIEKAIELAGKVRALLQPVDDDRNIIRSFPPSKSDNLPVAP